MLRSRRTSSIGSLRPAQCWRLSWLSATFGAHALPQQLNALQRLRPVLPVRKAHHDVLEPVVAPMRRDERSRPASRSARVVRARTSTLRVHAHSPRLALQKGAPSVVALLHEVQRGAAALCVEVKWARDYRYPVWNSIHTLWLHPISGNKLARDNYREPFCEFCKPWCSSVVGTFVIFLATIAR